MHTGFKEFFFSFLGCDTLLLHIGFMYVHIKGSYWWMDGFIFAFVHFI